MHFPVTSVLLVGFLGAWAYAAPLPTNQEHSVAANTANDKAIGPAHILEVRGQHTDKDTEAELAKILEVRGTAHEGVASVVDAEKASPAHIIEIKRNPEDEAEEDELAEGVL